MSCLLVFLRVKPTKFVRHDHKLSPMSCVASVPSLMIDVTELPKNHLNLVRIGGHSGKQFQPGLRRHSSAYPSQCLECRWSSSNTVFSWGSGRQISSKSLRRLDWCCRSRSCWFGDVPNAFHLFWFADLLQFDTFSCWKQSSCKSCWLLQASSPTGLVSWLPTISCHVCVDICAARPAARWGSEGMRIRHPGAPQPNWACMETEWLATCEVVCGLRGPQVTCHLLCYP